MKVSFCLCVLFALGATLAATAQSPEPQSASRHSNEVQGLIRAGQAASDKDDFPQAVSDFERARQSAPENLEVNRGLLLGYLQSGRLAEAEAIGQTAVARWPQDAQLEHWLGLVYFKESRNAKALELLKQAEKLDGAHFDIHFDIALVLLSGELYPAAAEELEKALKLDSKSALTRVLLGRAYQNTNRTLQAMEQFQMAVRLQPDIPLGHYHLGFAYASLGRNQEAIAEYEKEILQGGENPSAQYQLGHCLLESGNWKAAVAHLQQAVVLDTGNSDAYYDLGKALLLQGDAEGATHALRHSIEMKPANPSAHYQLARALEKAGQKEESQHEFAAFAALKKAQPVTGGMAAGPNQ